MHKWWGSVGNARTQWVQRVPKNTVNYCTSIHKRVPNLGRAHGVCAPKKYPNIHRIYSTVVIL